MDAARDSAPSIVESDRYEPPALVRLGTVEALTQGEFIQNPDAFNLGFGPCVNSIGPCTPPD